MRDRNRVSERGRVEENGREWESKIVRVRKPLRTAKEPALVFNFSRGRSELRKTSTGL